MNLPRRINFVHRFHNSSGINSQANQVEQTVTGRRRRKKKNLISIFCRITPLQVPDTLVQALFIRVSSGLVKHDTDMDKYN